MITIADIKTEALAHHAPASIISMTFEEFWDFHYIANGYEAITDAQMNKLRPKYLAVYIELLKEFWK